LSAPATQASSTSTGFLVAGYLCALFVPLIGVVLGVSALKKYNGVGTNHGHWIIAASVASFVIGFLMIASSGA
jgi:general stress protein CsbA